MLQEFGIGFCLFIGYYALAVVLLLTVRLRTRVPREVFRKMLHIMSACSIFILLHAFHTWYLSALTAVAFAGLVYPIIHFAERFPRVMDILVERKQGEIRFSLSLVFSVMAGLIILFWGILGPEWKFIIPAAVMGWGLGDAAAALVGKAVGRHRIDARLARSHKTWEGSLAMYVASSVAVFVSLLIYANTAWPICLLIALLSALFAAFTEIVSDGRVDTLTVPAVTSLVLYLLFNLLGGR